MQLEIPTCLTKPLLLPRLLFNFNWKKKSSSKWSDCLSKVRNTSLKQES